MKLQLHSAGDASPLPPQRAVKTRVGGPEADYVVLLPQTITDSTLGRRAASPGVPTARIVRRGVDLRGASPPSVLRWSFTTGCTG